MRRVRVLAALFGALIIPHTAALAQPAEPSEGASAGSAAALWRDLVYGESPESVSQKLLTVPGVKGAAVKNSRRDPAKFQLNVTYDGMGIDIFGELFSVTPNFAGRQLQSITLNGALGCANNSYERYSSILSLLAEKYRSPVTGQSPLRQGDFSDAIAKAGSVKTILANETTVVEFSSTFSRFEPPPPSYATGNLAALARQLLWNDYLSKRSECDGTGAFRSTFVISYVRVSDYRMQQRQDDETLQNHKTKALDAL